MHSDWIETRWYITASVESSKILESLKSFLGARKVGDDYRNRDTPFVKK